MTIDVSVLFVVAAYMLVVVIFAVGLFFSRIWGMSSGLVAVALALTAGVLNGSVVGWVIAAPAILLGLFAAVAAIGGE